MRGTKVDTPRARASPGGRVAKANILATTITMEKENLTMNGTPRGLVTTGATRTSISSPQRTIRSTTSVASRGTHTLNKDKDRRSTRPPRHTVPLLQLPLRQWVRRRTILPRRSLTLMEAEDRNILTSSICRRSSQAASSLRPILMVWPLRTSQAGVATFTLLNINQDVPAVIFLRAMRVVVPLLPCLNSILVARIQARQAPLPAPHLRHLHPQWVFIIVNLRASDVS